VKPMIGPWVVDLNNGVIASSDQLWLRERLLELYGEDESLKSKLFVSLSRFSFGRSSSFKMSEKIFLINHGFNCRAAKC
jgi:hypothetical protein